MPIAGDYGWGRSAVYAELEEKHFRQTVIRHAGGNWKVLDREWRSDLFAWRYTLIPA